MFNVWIISDSDDIAGHIRGSLDRLCIHGASVKIARPAATRQCGVLSATDVDVVLYGASEITTVDCERLRLLSANTSASLAVVAPMVDNAIVLRAIRAGAQDYLNLHENLGDDIAAFIAKARSERTSQPSQGRLVTVSSCHAPVDAALLAVNLAVAVARQVSTCGLVDLHHQGGDLALLLQLVPRHNLLDLIDHRNSIDEAMFLQALTGHQSGVRLLAGPPPFIDDAQLSPQLCEEILGLAKATLPFVIASIGDVQHSINSVAARDYDQMVVVVRPDLMSLHRAKHFVDRLRRDNVSMERLQIVAMGSGQRGQLPPEVMCKALTVPRIHMIPEDTVVTTISINLGRPIVLTSPNAPISRAIRHFATSLIGTSTREAATKRKGPVAGATAAALEAVGAIVGRK